MGRLSQALRFFLCLCSKAGQCACWAWFLAAALLVLGPGSTAGAQDAPQADVLPELEDFPRQPIRIVVYTSPGGLIDVTARRFARLAQEHAGHPFVVVNRPGGGGIVAFEQALREPADGHQMLAVTRSNISKMLATGREDLIRDLHWHAYIMDNAHVVITNAKEGPAGWGALLEAADAAERGQIWVGVDIGGVKHVSGVKIAEQAGINMRWIPFSSGGEAIAALLGNLGVAYLGNPRDALVSDDLRIVAVAAEERLERFPDASTFRELGIDGLEGESIWRGFAFRDGVPEAVQRWYDILIQRVIEDPRWKAEGEGEGVELRYFGADRFAEIVEKDRREYAHYLAQLGLLPENDRAASLVTALTRPHSVYWLTGAVAFALLAGAVLLGRTRWRHQRGDLTFLLVIIALAVVVFMMTVDLPPRSTIDPVGAAGIPQLLIALLIPLVLAQLALNLAQGGYSPPPVTSARLPLALGLILPYMVLVPILGYLLASALFMPVMLWYLGLRRPMSVAILTGSWLLVSEFVLRRLLMVDLPSGFVFN